MVKKIEIRNIDDIQEKLHFQFNLIWEKKVEYFQKIGGDLEDLRKLQKLLYFFITSGTTALFILIFLGIQFIIIISDLIIVIIFISYLRYLGHKNRKKLKFLKICQKNYIKLEKESNEISKIQIIIYSAVITITIIMLTFSLIGINTLMLIIIIVIYLIYVFIDEDSISN